VTGRHRVLTVTEGRRGTAGRLNGMDPEALGAPSSYLVLAEGIPVYSSDGDEIGRVEHVLAESDVDIFDGIVIAHTRMPGGARFVDAPLVDEIYERGVVVKLSAEQARELPIPSANPATMSADPADADEGELERKLRRAWDRISGQG
jgi:hypothetical protein